MHEGLRYSTPTAILMDQRLRDEVGDGVIEVVTRLRSGGKSWREIAEKLSGLTGYEVTHESVRQWAQRWGIDNREPAA